MDDRVQRAVDKLRGQLILAQAEVVLLRDRSDIDSQLRIEFIIRDIFQASLFIDELLLRIIELRLLKRRIEDEEIIIAILLMDD